MVREEPNPEDVRSTVRGLFDGPVESVTPIDRGVNALFRVDVGGGHSAVVKVPLYASEEEFLAEPALLERLGRETTVPVPTVHARGRAEESTFGDPYYVMDHLDGRQIDAITDLSPPARERLVSEAATHLAAIHAVRCPDEFGPLVGTDGDLIVEPTYESWAAFFEERVADVTAALRGDGPLTDAEPRFSDLAHVVRDALLEAPNAVAEASPRPSFVVRDYRLANLVLAFDGGGERIVGGVFDVGGMVGDGLLDVALTEGALIDLPLGGTEEAESLRDTFRTTYAARFDAETGDVFDGRYPYYRLYERAFRMKAFDYSVQFARESDPDPVAGRWRAFVADRVAEITAGD